MAQSKLESFRVFNNTRRVGVGFRFGGVNLGVGAFALLLLILVVGMAMTVLAGALPGVLGSVAMALSGVGWLLVFGAVVVSVIQLSYMSPAIAQIRDLTQFALLRESVSEPWFENFRAPDDEGGSMYRNY